MRMRIKGPSSMQKPGDRSGRAITIALSLTLFFLLIIWVAGPFGLWKLHMLKTDRKALYMANMRFDEENARLRKEIKALMTDPSCQEQVVRKKLGWVKDGELLYRFVDEGK